MIKESFPNIKIWPWSKSTSQSRTIWLSFSSFMIYAQISQDIWMKIMPNSRKGVLIDTAQSTSSSLISTPFSQIKTQRKVKELTFLFADRKRFSKVFSKKFWRWSAIQKMTFNHSKQTGIYMRTIMKWSKTIETMAYDKNLMSFE